MSLKRPRESGASHIEQSPGKRRRRSSSPEELPREQSLISSVFSSVRSFLGMGATSSVKHDKLRRDSGSTRSAPEARGRTSAGPTYRSSPDGLILQSLSVSAPGRSDRVVETASRSPPDSQETFVDSQSRQRVKPPNANQTTMLAEPRPAHPTHLLGPTGTLKSSGISRARSPSSLPLPPSTALAKSWSHAAPTNLFDEGSLRPGTGAPDDPVYIDSDSSSSSTSTHASPAPELATPPSDPAESPDLSRFSSLHLAVREYPWMCETDTPPSSASRHSKRDRQNYLKSTKKRSSNFSRNKLRSEWHAPMAVQSTLQQFKWATSADAKSARNVSEYFRRQAKRPNQQARLKSMVSHGLESKEAYQAILGVPSKTLDDVVSPKKPDTSLEAIRRKSRNVIESSRQYSFSDADEIRKRLEKTILEEDQKIQARLKPAAPTKMSKERQAQVNTHLANRSFESIVRTDSVSASSLATLRGATWLNDEIINFYVTLIAERSLNPSSGKNAKITDVHCFNSFFWETLDKKGYEKGNLKRWTKRAKVDIFAKDAVVFPINWDNTHWTAGCINMAKKRFEYYDSMSDRVHKRRHVYEMLREYVGKEHQEKKGKPFDFQGWTDMFNEGSPQQNNGSDCGVFVCQTLETVARGKDLSKEANGYDFTAQNMPYIRSLMVLEIANKALEPRWPKEG